MRILLLLLFLPTSAFAITFNEIKEMHYQECQEQMVDSCPLPFDSKDPWLDPLNLNYWNLHLSTYYLNVGGNPEHFVVYHMNRINGLRFASIHGIIAHEIAHHKAWEISGIAAHDDTWGNICIKYGGAYCGQRN